MTVNINLSSKENKRENNLIEDVGDDIYELLDSDFSKAAARVFDKINSGKDDVLP